MDTSAFHLSANARVTCHTVGNEGEPLVIVDSFMAGAQLLKQHAMSLNQFIPADNYYPGLRMPAPKLYPVALARNLQGVLREVFGLEAREVTNAVAQFSIVTRPPEQLSPLQRVPHFDAASRGSLAAVHYLVEDPTSGTALYRHKELGFEYIDSRRYDLYMQCVRRQLEQHPPNSYICGDTKNYQSIASVEARFNRLILYRGSSLHSGVITPDYSFDASPATGRLTITTFIEFKGVRPPN